MDGNTGVFDGRGKITGNAAASDVSINDMQSFNEPYTSTDSHFNEAPVNLN
jgi:hypothetical protein